MTFTKQLIAGAAMAAMGALGTAQAAPFQMPAAGNGPYAADAFSASASSRSRADVQAEAAAALAAGGIASGEMSMVEFQVQPFVSEKTRVQVQAETLEARRLGLLDRSGELGFPQITPVQHEMIRTAGLRARDAATMHAAR